VGETAYQNEQPNYQQRNQIPEIMNDIIEEIINKANDEFNLKLENYVCENLKRIGHCFHDRQDFLDFCATRITRISKTNDEYELYLDIDTEKILVGIYSSKTEFDFTGEKMNCTGNLKITIG